MWTKETHGRMAKIERRTKRYPSDLTDAEMGADSIAPKGIIKLMSAT